MRKRTFIAALSMGMVVAVAIGYAQVRNFNAGSLGNSEEAQTLVQVYQAVQSQYLHKVDDATLLRGAIGGMLNSLDDPFTSYSSPEETQSDEQQLSGQFYGIGVLLKPTTSDGLGATAEVVYKGQPADQGGLRAGDILVKVNGEDITKLRLNQAVTKIRGPLGSQVQIEVLRDGSLFTFEMRRDEIKLYAVTSEILPDHLGYLSINTFYNQQIFDQLDQAVAQFKAAGVDRLILDLRDNGGGLLCAGTYVADQFLSRGTIVSLRDRSGKSHVMDSLGDQCPGTAKSSKTDFLGKMVVLVNQNSASASEIVAGALQDSKRATVVGDKTFGKGVAQTILKLRDGGEVRLVNQEWLTPSGRAIHQKGIEPDVSVADTRFGKVLNLDGIGAEPGEKITVSIGKEKIELTADKDGNFKYTRVPKRSEVSDKQGVAKVDLDGDAQLQKALTVLGVDLAQLKSKMAQR